MYRRGLIAGRSCLLVCGNGNFYKTELKLPWNKERINGWDPKAVDRIDRNGK